MFQGRLFMARLPESWITTLADFAFFRGRDVSDPRLSSLAFRRHRFEQYEARRLLAVFTVNDAADTNTFDFTDDTTTLREAVVRANQSPDGDTINFALPAGEDTITLTLGDLDITEALIINGPGKNVDGDFEITISGNHSSRIFNVVGASLEVYGLRLTEGSATSFPESEGGAIRAFHSDLRIGGSEISENQAESGGGHCMDVMH
jgi:hypothetical protein